MYSKSKNFIHFHWNTFIKYTYTQIEIMFVSFILKVEFTSQCKLFCVRCHTRQDQRIKIFKYLRSRWQHKDMMGWWVTTCHNMSQHSCTAWPRQFLCMSVACLFAKHAETTYMTSYEYLTMRKWYDMCKILATISLHRSYHYFTHVSSLFKIHHCNIM